MTLKPDGKLWSIREQVIEDLVTGLTFQFEVRPSGEFGLHIFGDGLPLGNRTIVFDKNGNEAGAGTHTGLCRPAWLTEIAE